LRLGRRALAHALLGSGSAYFRVLSEECGRARKSEPPVVSSGNLTPFGKGERAERVLHTRRPCIWIAIGTAIPIWQIKQCRKLMNGDRLMPYLVTELNDSLAIRPKVRQSAMKIKPTSMHPMS